MDRRIIALDSKIFSRGESSGALLPLRLREVLTLALITRVYLHMTGRTVTVPHLDQPVIFHAVECFEVFTFRDKQRRQ